MNLNNLKIIATCLVFIVGLVVVINSYVKRNTSSVNVKTLQTQNIPVQTKPGVPEVKGKQIYSIKIPADRAVILGGEIGENAFNVAMQIASKGNKNQPIYLLISSPGGSIMAGAQIINAIEASPVPVYTVCLDLCASMAAFIHQYGTQRLMLDRSLLMFHDASGSVQGPFPHVRSRFEAMNRYASRFNAYVANRVGISLEALEQSEHVEGWIDTEDATERNFNDKIAFIQIINKGNNMDMQELLKSSTVKSQTTFFDLDWKN